MMIKSLQICLHCVMSINEIKEKLHDEIENETTDTDSSDMDLPSEDPDF